MSRSKLSNALVLDENRFKISQQNALLPGGPQNNNPTNVVSVDPQPASLSGVSEHPYGDTGNHYHQMGAIAINPINVKPSGLPQFAPPGQRINSVPYGLQDQPDISGISVAPDGMESGRLAQQAQQRGLPGVGALGPQGLPATPAPGAFPPAFPGSSGPSLVAGVPSAEQAATMTPQNSMGPMTPGATKTTIRNA